MRRTKANHHTGTCQQPGALCQQPRRSGDYSCNPLCVQHAIRPHRMGRRAPGSRTQDPDREEETVSHISPPEGAQALPLARRERIRHILLRARFQQHISRLGHGRSGKDERRGRQAGGGGDRRRQHERRTCIRGPEQRLVNRQQPAHHPERQQYEH